MQETKDSSKEIERAIIVILRPRYITVTKVNNHYEVLVCHPKFNDYKIEHRISIFFDNISKYDESLLKHPIVAIPLSTEEMEEYIEFMTGVR